MHARRMRVNMQRVRAQATGVAVSACVDTRCREQSSSRTPISRRSSPTSRLERGGSGAILTRPTLSEMSVSRPTLMLQLAQFYASLLACVFRQSLLASAK